MTRRERIDFLVKERKFGFVDARNKADFEILRERLATVKSVEDMKIFILELLQATHPGANL